MTQPKNFHFFTFLFFTILACFSARPFWTLSAQEKIISFADSTSLSPNFWQGTLSKFSCTSNGLQLYDKNPKKQYNQAFISHKYTNSNKLTWTGSFLFTMTPSSQNRIEILLYPIRDFQDKEGNYLTRYITLSIGPNKYAELCCVTIVQKDLTSPIRFKGRETIITSSHLFSFNKKGENKLDYIVTFDSESKRWALYLRSNVFYLSTEYLSIGSTEYIDDYNFFDKKWLRTYCCVTYSKKNASSVLLKSMACYGRLLSPDELNNPSGSIIQDIIYEGDNLTMLCYELPSIEQASFTLTPNYGKLAAKVEDKKIVLPLPNPLSIGSYELLVSGIAFPNGRISPSETFRFNITGEDNPNETPSSSLALSEIMPYPEVDGVEFIELYNPSESVLNLKEYGMIITKEGHPSKVIPLEVSNYLLNPKQYIVLCGWKESIHNQYPTLEMQNIAELKRFPTLPNDEGQIILLKLKEDKTIENFAYRYKDYAPDKKKRGYSLERISFLEKANDPKNWQATSSKENYATPGKPNELGPNKRQEDSTTDDKSILSLESIIKYIKEVSQDKNIQLRILFFSLRGERIGIWQHTKVLTWAQNFSSTPLSLTFPKLSSKIFILSLEIKEKGKKRIKTLSLPIGIQ